MNYTSSTPVHTKWADYGISAVRYNAAHSHIDRVRAHVDNGQTIGPGDEYLRPDVVAAIKRGVTFVTIVNNGGKWNKGQPVNIVVIGGIEYLKTKNNGLPGDN